MAQSDALLLTTVISGLYAVVVVAICAWQWFAVRTWRDALFMLIIGMFIAGGVENLVLSPIGEQVEALLAESTKESIGSGLATLFVLVLAVPITRLLLVSAETQPTKAKQWSCYGGALACLAVAAYLSSGALY